ncbi:MAG: hypothetical protein WCB90_13640 [Methanosarcina sp.]|jgi:hypothetical protein
MTKINLSSRICSSKHNVMGRVEGDNIIIKIDTPCEKFRKLSCLEFPLQKLPENKRDLTREMEKQTKCSFECTRECALDFTRECLIPSAIFNVCRIENDRLTESLTKFEKKSISLLFEKEIEKETCAYSSQLPAPKTSC